MPSAVSAAFGATITETSEATLTYNGTPAANNLAGSMAQAAFTDQFGNRVLAGVVAYNGDHAIVLDPSGAVVPYVNSTASAQSGTWTPGTPIGGAGSGQAAGNVGTQVLSAGSAVVTPASGVPQGAVILVSYFTVGANAGVLSVSATTSNTFTISSSNPLDTSTVAWAIL